MRIQKPTEPAISQSSGTTMETAAKIFRRSIFTLVQNFQYFTTTAAFLAFPYAASVLVFQSYIPSSSLLGIIHSRIRTLFDAAGFPSSSEFSAILSAKLSQTIAISFLALPLTLSSFLLSKASVIRALLGNKELPERIYSSLLVTQLCNSLLILSANAACFFLLLIAFNLSSPRFELFVSVVGAVFCSIVLANAFIICNLALVLSGTETTGGFISILKACVLIKGRTAAALSLAVPINMSLAAVEALFQYRVVRVHHLHAESGISSVALEGMFIAFMYATLLVLDTIIACFFLRSCQEVCHIGHDRRLASQIDIDQQALRRVKIVEDHP